MPHPEGSYAGRARQGLPAGYGYAGRWPYRNRFSGSGIAEGALEETIAYVKERKQFGRAIAAFQNTQFELAEMKARVEAAKYLVYAAALKKQQAMDGAKVRYSVEAAQAKLIAARTASDVTRRCLQLFGGYGYTRDYPIERMMRDAKITEIYEGTSEVQMMVISGALLK